MGKNSLRKKILLKGVTTTPDDYLCEDGELAGAMGVENTDGGMEGVSQHGPKTVMEMENEERVVFEHKVKPCYNWIVWDKEANGSICYICNDDEAESRHKIFTSTVDVLSSATLPKIEAIGNTLIVNVTDGEGDNVMHYVLWKPNDHTYKYLGTHIPEISIEFGLGVDYRFDFDQGDVNDNHRPQVPFRIDDLLESISAPNFTIADKNKAMITSAVMASINRTQSKAMKDGYFVQPFLVRYALKMYDGSTTMASVPVYMPVTEKKGGLSWPLCVVDEVWDNGLRFHTEHAVSKLKYRVLDDSLDAISEWSDIVTGVEIFVTEQIYTYYPSKEIEKTYGTVDTSDENNDVNWAGVLIDSKDGVRFYGKLDGEHLMPATLDGYDSSSYTQNRFQLNGLVERRLKYKGWTRDQLVWIDGNNNNPDLKKNPFTACTPTESSFNTTKYWHYNDGGSDGHDRCNFARTARILMLMPEKTDAEFVKEVKESSRFYKISTINLEDLKESSHFISEEGIVTLEDVDIEKGYINSISVLPQMDDEYRSHDTLSCKVMNTYNARLNLADVRRELWNGFNANCFLMHYDERLEGDSTKKLEIYVRIKQDMQTFVVKGEGTVEKGRYNIFPYFYYPDTKADRLYVKIGNDWEREFKLEEHTGLNGALFYNGDMNDISQWENKKAGIPDATTGNIVWEHNKLYTSEAENPWRFTPENVNTVSSGKILGVGAVTTALSQGQHGSFPMYCMTTEGIYSLTVNQTGGWQTSQTVTRDVMREDTPILLIDDAIVFMSEQGLMLLQGDKTVSMVEAQKGRPKIRISTMAGLAGLVKEGELADFDALLSSTEATDAEIDDLLTGDLMSYVNRQDTGLYYDYVNQRVIVGCEGKPYSWVYYLNRRQWTAAPYRLLNRVNTYPECYAMLKDSNDNNYMVRLDNSERDTEEDDEAEDSVLMLTRPIKLQEAADMLKELENVTVEGLFEKNRMGLCVWGTRDYQHWHLVGSCKGLHLVRKHGSGYRAFVVAIMGKIGQGEYLDSITMQYCLRHTQKLHGMGY